MRLVTEYILGNLSRDVVSLRTAVLLSAGLDSAVLAAAEAHIVDVCTRCMSAPASPGSAEELAALARLLAAPPLAALAPAGATALRRRDVYPPTHWALRGEPPAFDTPDEDVYLTGRNIILLSKTAIYCAQHGIPRIVLGPLAGNPFPDATPAFFDTMARALSLGLAHPIRDRRAVLRTTQRPTSSASASGSACRWSSRCPA